MRFPAKFLRYRIIGLSGVLLAAALIQACSAIKVAYNQAPDLAYWYLDGYMDFNGSQSVLVKEELVKLQAWHRHTQLPAYLDTLQKIKQKMPGELDAAQTCDVYFEAKRKLLAVSERAEPAAAALATTFTPEQIAHMERKFEKGNADYREDFVDASPRRSHDKRYKQAVKRAESLYGRLDKKQLDVIGKAIDQSRFNARLSYAERTRRQRDALQTLRTLAANRAAATDTQTRTAMKGVFERSINSPNAEYRDYLDKLTADNCRIVAEVHNSTSTEQRVKAMEVISGYQKDLQTLAAKN